jgi:uncharacterized membrane protein
MRTYVRTRPRHPPEIYDWLLFVHIVAAMVWVGGLAGLLLNGVLALRSGDESRFVRTLRVYGPALLMPAAILVLAFGIWLVLDTDAWSFGQGWVDAGLGLLVAAVLLGAIFLSRTGLAAERAVEAGDSAAARAALRRWAYGIAAILVLLVVATWDMVMKPGL